MILRDFDPQTILVGMRHIKRKTVDMIVECHLKRPFRARGQGLLRAGIQKHAIQTKITQQF